MYIDASAGPGGDGSKARPYRRIGDALSAPPLGPTTFAIAAGTYNEDVRVSRSGNKLWGRCPSMVEIVGTGTESTALVLDASNTEAHDLAVRGPRAGVAISGARNAVLDRLWIHDVAETGLAILDEIGPTSARVERSLIERVGGTGVLAAGTDAKLNGVAVRDVARLGPSAVGIGATASPKTKNGSTLTLTSSLVERSLAGVVVASSQAHVERTLVRDVSEGDERAYGVAFLHELRASSGSVKQSVIERARSAGISAIGSDVDVEAVTVIGTKPESVGRPLGYGLLAQGSLEPYRPAAVRAARSRVAGAHAIGAAALDGHLELDGVWIDGTRAAAEGEVGDGVLVWSYKGNGTALIRRALIERSARVGIANFSGSIDLGDSILACNRIPVDGERFEEKSFTVRDSGGNVCGCGEKASCAVTSSNLKPPPAPR
jgi:hypothetical protein